MDGLVREGQNEKRGSAAIPNIIYALAIIIILVSFINVYVLSGMSNTITGKIAVFEEENKPALIKVTKILYPDCDDCYDINQALDQIKALNVDVTEEKELQWDSSGAQSLISQYGINILPTIVITGETRKPNTESSWGQIGEIKDDGTVIFTKQNLPYYDISKQDVIGMVSVISLVDSSCTQCFNMEGIVDLFRRAGVAISDERTLEYDSQEANELIDRFGIQRIPALIVSKDVTEYDAINQIWDQLNAEEKEGGFYALHAVQPPYRDLTSGEIAGLVTLINLVDDSCPDCYDISIQKPILLRFGLAITNEITHDISSSEGKDLIEKYGITKVPTILLSPEASLYSALNQAWSQVGTIETDGWYVFRNPEVLGDVIYNTIGEEA